MVLLPLTQLDCFNDDVIILQTAHPHGCGIITIVALKPSNQFAIDTKPSLGCDVHSTKPHKGTITCWSPVLYDITENFLIHAIEYLDAVSGLIKREESRKVFITAYLPPFGVANKVTFCLKSAEVPYCRIPIGGITARYSPVGSDKHVTRGSVIFLTADYLQLLNIEMIAPGAEKVWEYFNRILLQFPIIDPTWRLPQKRSVAEGPENYQEIYSDENSQP